MGSKTILSIFLVLCVCALFSCEKISNSFMHIKADTAYNQGEYAAAIEIYKELVEKNPKNPMVRWNLGIAYYSNGDLLNCRRQAAKLRVLGRDDLADDLLQLAEEPR